MPLKDISGMIKDNEHGGKLTLSTTNNSAFKAYFDEVLPVLDRDRVYTSDIKTVVKWYNLLMEKGYLEEEEAEATEEAPLVEDAEIVEERTEEAATTSEAPESTTTEEED